MTGKGQRLDTALVIRGFASGREKAKELIAAGLVTVNSRPAVKASQMIQDTDGIDCTDMLHRYVGRGGEKLEKALQETGLSPKGFCCLDVGASTGGFTDCLLQHGASRVYALDVGHGQLHPQLCADERVVNLEGMDVRLTDEILIRIGMDRPEFCVMDVSFISLETIWPAVEKLLNDRAVVICLIKPQFEAGRSAVGKKGVVKDPAIHQTVLRQIIAFWASAGWLVDYLSFSPITGGEGNIEYLAAVRRTDVVPVPVWSGDIRELTLTAKRTLYTKGGRTR